MSNRQDNKLTSYKFDFNWNNQSRVFSLFIGTNGHSHCNAMRIFFCYIGPTISSGLSRRACANSFVENVHF